MRTRRWLVGLFVASTLALSGVATVEPVASAIPVLSPERPGAALQVTRVTRYRMAGRIRPLLFWMGKDNVGFARVVWRQGDERARGYELLVGTDPKLAPRAINRWGYIAEEADGHAGSVMAFMSRSDEETLDDVQASAAYGGDFKLLRSRTRDGLSTWQTERLQTGGTPTIHDLDALLADVRTGHDGGIPRQRSVPAEARSGFLAAVAELVDASVGATREPAARSDAVRRLVVPYVFGQQSHELRIASVKAADAATLGSLDQALAPVLREAGALRTTFEIRTPATDTRTQFDIIYGTRGGLAGVPLFMTWQPRWWLKVELRLESAP